MDCLAPGCLETVCYARLYALTRDELRYILDPADVMGADYPSETFRGLKNNEMKEFGEYRTARLVLAAWDQLERGELGWWFAEPMNANSGNNRAEETTR
ncbi:MAG: hypothetical protein H7838_04475 [Magnetococcus sp. DMHC-8]